MARLAGVSVATVSNVMTGRVKFSDETRERVEEAIRELAFHPEAAARHLKRRETNTLGILIPIMEGPGRLEDNPIYWDMVCAVEAEARALGYRVLVAQTTPDDDLAFVVERNLDGLIILGAYDDYLVFARARALGVPLVLVDSYVAGGAAQVRIDDYAGGRLVAEHLLGLGHKQVGLITGTLREQGVHFERYRGFRDALIQAGVPLQAKWTMEGPVSFQGGRDLGHRLLTQGERPTAVFASADNLALGVMMAARSGGLVVPRDLSLIGFDDIPLGGFAAPALTTVRQDTRRKGQEAVRLIMWARSGGDIQKKTVCVGIELVVRESTAAYAKRGSLC